MIDAPKAKLPPHPPGLGNCEKCAFFVSALKVEMVMTAQGPVPVAVIRAQGALASGNKFEQAPCARFPQWVVQPGMGWCWEWKPLIDA